MGMECSGAQVVNKLLYNKHYCNSSSRMDEVIKYNLDILLW